MVPDWRDITIPMQEGMTVWPGDPSFQAEPLCRIASGDSCNTTALHLCTHTGTHMDAPWHFENEGATLEKLDTTLFFGHAQLLDLTSVDYITPQHLDAITEPRVLLKTRNSHYPVNAPFQENFLALEPSSAQYLIEKGVRLVGIDYLSIAPYKDDAPTHQVLLRAGVICIEGLCLEGLPADIYEFIVLPLPLQGTDGSPCRAFIRPKE